LPWCWSQFVGFLIFIISLPWRWSIFIIFSHDLYKGLSLFLPATWRTFSLGVDISLQKDGSRILPNSGQDWCTWMNSTNQWLNVGISNGIYIYNKHLEFIISKSWKNRWTFEHSATWMSHGAFNSESILSHPVFGAIFLGCPCWIQCPAAIDRSLASQRYDKEKSKKSPT
jgi:hypothetical protein